MKDNYSVDNGPTDQISNMVLPNVAIDDVTRCDKAEIKMQGKISFAFEGSLITMENIYKYIDEEEYKKDLKDGDGIGTSATRANIIAELSVRIPY